MDLAKELLAIARTLNLHRIPYAVCGGLAVTLHGYPRMTKDIDLLVREKDIARIKRGLNPLDFIIESNPMTFRAGTEFETRINRLTKFVGEEFLALDLIHVADHLEQIWKDRVTVTVKGVKIKLVSREGLMLMKQRAGRPVDLFDLEKLQHGDKDERTP